MEQSHENARLFSEGFMQQTLGDGTTTVGDVVERSRAALAGQQDPEVTFRRFRDEYQYSAHQQPVPPEAPQQ